MSDDAQHHLPVMLTEIVALLAPALQPVESGPPTIVDCTLGLGGHAEALLAACPDAVLIGLDRDPAALALAGKRLAPFGDRVQLVEAVYDELPEVLDRLGRRKVQGVLLDLGVSSMQIDDPRRGFAYAQDAPLDMRMGRQELTAAAILNTYSRAELASILRRYGEERFADRIARRIVAERDREPFTTSGRLVQLLYDTIPMASRKTGGHPAKRTFQALRIEVNDELAALESVLPSAIAALAVGGRIAVLAYHSLEDRLVKQILSHRVARPGASRPAGGAARDGSGAAPADSGRPAPERGGGGGQSAGRLGAAPRGGPDRRTPQPSQRFGGERVSALWAPITGWREERAAPARAPFPTASRRAAGRPAGPLSVPAGADRGVRPRHGRTLDAEHDAAEPGVPGSCPQPAGDRTGLRPGRSGEPAGCGGRASGDGPAGVGLRHATQSLPGVPGDAEGEGHRRCRGPSPGPRPRR